MTLAIPDDDYDSDDPVSGDGLGTKRSTCLRLVRIVTVDQVYTDDDAINKCYVGEAENSSNTGWILYRE